MTISRERPTTATSYARFALRDGQRTDDCPQLTQGAIASLTGDGLESDSLYIICEPVELGPRAIPVGASIMAAIRDAYAGCDRSDPVAAIASAIDAANEVLYARNRAGVPSARVFLGVTCLIVRGNDLVICQVPPTQALIVQNGVPIALPELSTWRDDYQPHTTGEGPYGLGMHAEAAPLLFRATLERGDLLALCSSNLAALLDENDLGPLLDDDPAAARDCLAALAERHHLGLAYAAVIEPPVPTFPGAAHGEHSLEADDIVVDTDEGAATGISASWLERSLREMRDRARVITWPRRNPERQAARSAAEPRRVVPLRDDITIERDPFAFTHEPLPDRQESRYDDWDRDDTRNDAFNPYDVLTDDPHDMPGNGRSSGQRWSSTVRLTDDDWQSPLSSREGARADADEDDEGHGSGDDEGWEDEPRRVARGRGSWQILSGVGVLPVLLAGSVLERLRPAGRRERVGRVWPLGSLERHDRRSPLRLWLPVLGIIAIVVLGFAAVAGWRGHKARVAEDRFNAAVTDIGTRRQAAVGSRDRQAARGQLLSLQESLAVLPTAGFSQRQERVVAEREALAKALDKVDGVERLSVAQIELLAPAPAAVGAAASRPQIVVGNGQQFVLLDGAVYALDSRARTFTKALTKGERVGGVAVGQVLGITWRIDRLLAFDEGRAFMRDASGAWAVVPLGATGLKPVAADTFDGNLYILAAERGQIAKFASGAYASAPQPWSSARANSDLALAVDLTIDKDIYVLLSDGRVLDFYQGEAKATFSPATVPALVGATALHAAPDGKYLYIVDPKEGRIIRLGRDGTLAGVYKAAAGAPTFTGARELTVDEAAGVAYLLTDEGLLAARLPAVSPSPAPVPSGAGQPAPTATPAATR